MTPAYVEFSYRLDSTLIVNHYSENSFYIPEAGVRVKEKYMVALDKNSPHNSFILFNYPIKDSTDFKRYLKGFKFNPPKFDNNQ
jgi:hypothetical protein